MTYQRDPDPNRPDDAGLGHGPRRDYLRREDGSWSIIPMVLAVIFFVVLGFMFFGGDRTANPNRTTEIDRTAPSTPTTVPKTTPTQPN